MALLWALFLKSDSGVDERYGVLTIWIEMMLQSGGVKRTSSYCLDAYSLLVKLARGKEKQEKKWRKVTAVAVGKGGCETLLYGTHKEVRKKVWGWQPRPFIPVLCPTFPPRSSRQHSSSQLILTTTLWGWSDGQAIGPKSPNELCG